MEDDTMARSMDMPSWLSRTMFVSCTEFSKWESIGDAMSFQLICYENQADGVHLEHILSVSAKS